MTGCQGSRFRLGLWFWKVRSRTASRSTSRRTVSRRLSITASRTFPGSRIEPNAARSKILRRLAQELVVDEVLAPAQPAPLPVW